MAGTSKMNVSAALKSRISTRAFLDTSVSQAQVRDILDIARWAPSGGNLQPWRVHVVMGAARNRLVAAVQASIESNPLADQSELTVYPPGLVDPWRARRTEVGEDMYKLLGIPREDRPARLRNLLKNYNFFGAPIGLFFSIHRQFDKGQWAHLGMFMQSVALVAAEKGLATCIQEAWTRRAKTVSAFLALDEEEQLYCGMALGYADPSAPVNTLRSTRIEVDQFTTILSK